MKIDSLQKGLIYFNGLKRKDLQSSVTFKDRTPYENTGTKYGSVLKFLGLDSNHVTIADSASFAGGATLSAFTWVNGSSQNTYIFGQYDYGASQRSWSITSISDTKLRVLLSDDGSFDEGHRKQYYTSNSILDGTWHLVGFTFNAGTLKLYIDGVEASVTKDYDDAITTIHNSTANVTIGSALDSGAAAGVFTGSIGKSSVYNRELTATEVLNLYRGVAVSSTSLAAQYKFNDASGTTLTDSSGNSNNGTLTNFTNTTAAYGDSHTSGWVTANTPVVFTLDKKGNEGGICFDGGSGYINCGAGTSLNLGTADFAISLWINTSDSNRQCVFDKSTNNDGTNPKMFLTKETNGKLEFYIHDGSTSVDAISTLTTYHDGSWHHIVINVDRGTGVSLYKDGGLDSTTTSANATNTLSNNGNLYLGKRYDGLYFNCQLDNVRIYNRLLTTTEITKLYQIYR